MKMTQIIWYRSGTAPEPKPGKPAPAYQASWEVEQPNASFITISPAHIREAFWMKIARPIKGIMYHGWGLAGSHRAGRRLPLHPSRNKK